MNPPCVALWNSKGRLLWASHLADEVDRETYLGSVFWEWFTDPSRAEEAFLRAMMSIDDSFEGEIQLNPTAIGDYRFVVAPLNKTVAVVSIANRFPEPLRYLSAKEREILALLPVHENAEIMRRLDISRSTYDTHRKSMRAKLGCANNSQLIAFAALHG